MLSQLTKTIKMALKSTDEERAILRARSAVQRFPVVEWRQRMEDLHRRSISTSRSIATVDAWRPSDGLRQNFGPHVGPEVDIEEWDSGSPAIGISRDGSPVQSSQDALTAQNDYLTAPRRRRRGSLSTDVSEDEFGRYSRDGIEGRPDFGGFLSRANRQIAKDQRHVGDPFLSSTPSANRPFGLHSRASSVESIASIVDEKADSPLNKAIATVRVFNVCSIKHANVFL
jgi:alpha-1,3-glucan synthase